MQASLHLQQHMHASAHATYEFARTSELPYMTASLSFTCKFPHAYEFLYARNVTQVRVHMHVCLDAQVCIRMHVCVALHTCASMRQQVHPSFLSYIPSLHISKILEKIHLLTV